MSYHTTKLEFTYQKKICARKSEKLGQEKLPPVTDPKSLPALLSSPYSHIQRASYAYDTVAMLQY